MAIKGYTVPTTFTLVDRMSSVLGQMQGRVKAFQSKISAMKATTGNMLTGMGDGMITRGLTVGSVAVGALGKKAIQTASEFEAIKTAIRFVSGDAANAEKNLAFLDEIVNTLKIDYAVTAESLKRFMGAMKATNIPADKQRKMFYEMASSTRVLGMSGEQTERVFYALGEMFSKGQVMSQELKLQLGNVLPGAVKMFATSMGKSVPQLMDMMNKGAVDSEKYVAAFTAYVYEQFKGGIPDAVKTMNASLTSMENKWKRTLETIGLAMNRAGILTMIEGYLDGISRWVTANQELIKSGFQGFLEGVKNVFSWIYEHWDSIVSGLKIWLGAWAVLKVINKGLGVMEAAMEGMALLLTRGGALIAGVGLLALAVYKVTKEWGSTSAAIEASEKRLQAYKDKMDELTGANVTLTKEEFAEKYRKENPEKFVSPALEDYNATIGKILSLIPYHPKTAESISKLWLGSDVYNDIKERAGVDMRLNDLMISLAYEDYLKNFDSGNVYSSSTSKKSGRSFSISEFLGGIEQKPSYVPYPGAPYNTDAINKNQDASLNINITTDKGTSAEVVSSSGVIPVTVTTNNNAFSLVR